MPMKKKPTILTQKKLTQTKPKNLKDSGKYSRTPAELEMIGPLEEVPSSKSPTKVETSTKVEIQSSSTKTNEANEGEHTAKELSNSEEITDTAEIAEGDFDSEDLELAEGMTLEDFEDPEYYSDEDKFGDEDEDSDFVAGHPSEMLYELFSEFFEYDSQGLTEVMCQIRDSIDANSKCLLRMAHELRNMQNLYMHVNLGEESQRSQQPVKLCPPKDVDKDSYPPPSHPLKPKSKVSGHK